MQFAACTLPVYQAFFLATKSLPPPNPSWKKSQSLDAPALVCVSVRPVLSLVVWALPARPPRIPVLVIRLEILGDGPALPAAISLAADAGDRRRVRKSERTIRPVPIINVIHLLHWTSGRGIPQAKPRLAFLQPAFGPGFA